MHILQSALAHRDGDFAQLRSALAHIGFSIGGGWTYDGGYFDHLLGDDVHVRIPFTHVRGHLDADADDVDATVRLGRPFVLRHVVRTGNDPTVHGGGVVSALVNQFQSPADADAPLSDAVIAQARAWIARTDAHVQRVLHERLQDGVLR